jgi:hypothetical protein
LRGLGVAAGVSDPNKAFHGLKSVHEHCQLCCNNLCASSALFIRRVESMLGRKTRVDGREGSSGG